jgi:hypothetical protein
VLQEAGGGGDEGKSGGIGDRDDGEDGAGALRCCPDEDHVAAAN